MSVLDELNAAAATRARALSDAPPALRSTAPSFAAALRGKQRLAVIAEFKRRSPSRGAIATTADPTDQARAYLAAGAAAISVLTEPTRFGGSQADLEAVVAAVDGRVPVLMKDFVVARPQVYQAARSGASAVLLIVRSLSDAQLHDLSTAAAECGLDALVEAHDAEDLRRALALDHAVLGVNNRDLRSLEVDLTRAPQLLATVPDDRITVAESGYARDADLEPVRGLADAVLVGTSLMLGGDLLAEAAR